MGETSLNESHTFQSPHVCAEWGPHGGEVVGCPGISHVAEMAQVALLWSGKPITLVTGK